MKIPKFNFQLKSLKEGDEKAQPIILTMTVKGKRIREYLGVSITPKNWDKVDERAFVDKNLTERKQRELRKINRIIDTIVRETTALIQSLNDYIDGMTPEETVDYFKGFLYIILGRQKAIDNEEDRVINLTPIQFFEEYINGMSKQIVKATGTYTNERTIQHHRIVLKRVNGFLNYTHKEESFTIFGKTFEKEFVNWALGVKKYRLNTIPATFSVMKVWLKQAEKKGLLKDEAFHHWQSKGTEVDNIYLTEEEIERLYHLDIPVLKENGKIDTKSRIEETRDLFIIACYTGLRLSDWEKLNGAIWNIEKRLVTIFTQKTKNEVVLPLNETLIALYKKYNGLFPHSVDKTHSLAQLRELGRFAEINDEVLVSENIGGQIETKKYLKYQQIMNHTARRSFATNMFLKGIPTIIIMKMTGHKTEENFLKYIKITKEQAALQALSIMDKLNNIGRKEQ